MLSKRNNLEHVEVFLFSHVFHVIVLAVYVSKKKTLKCQITEIYIMPEPTQTVLKMKLNKLLHLFHTNAILKRKMFFSKLFNLFERTEKCISNTNNT